MNKRENWENEEDERKLRKGRIRELKLRKWRIREKTKKMKNKRENWENEK